MPMTFTALSVSLDGFIAGSDDSPEQPLGEGGERLFDWYFNADTEYEMPSHRRVLKVPAVSAKLVRERFEGVGAVVTGRRLFDITDAWDGIHPTTAPVFVVTKDVPQEWAGKESPFTFVTDGVASAVEKAKKVAKDKRVFIAGGANIVQQCIEAGLLDELQIDVVPVLLGDGVRLFDHIDNPERVTLEKAEVTDAPGVTHFRFKVVT